MSPIPSFAGYFDLVGRWNHHCLEPYYFDIIHITLLFLAHWILPMPCFYVHIILFYVIKLIRQLVPMHCFVLRYVGFTSITWLVDRLFVRYSFDLNKAHQLTITMNNQWNWWASIGKTFSDYFSCWSPHLISGFLLSMNGVTSSPSFQYLRNIK